MKLKFENILVSPFLSFIILFKDYYVILPFITLIKTKRIIMKRLLIAVLFLVVLMSINASANEERTSVNAHLQSVTVYRSGAEMMHTATVNLKAGANELVIDQLANYVDINSIQVKVADGITILGTEFGNNHLVIPIKTARVKLLEDSLESLNRMIEKADLGISNIGQLQEILKVLFFLYFLFPF
jgi:hypothetical protein